MTTAELAQVREALWNVNDCADCDSCNESSQKAIAILDAELARPEAREWRVVVDDHS